ncbi:MAG: potassium channel protein [Planctomycetota bacterium]|nr:potassium channel protein [Planctomycetota bacterium]
MTTIRRGLNIVGLLMALTLIGTVGFRAVSGANWIDCLYMSVITLSTVGFREAVPLDDIGKLFVVVYLIVGFGVFTYSAMQLGQWMVSVEFRALLEQRRMNRQIDKLDRHFIICGLGRVGRSICQYLAQRRQSFLVIDTNEELLRAECEQSGWPFVVGDATDDSTLKDARISQARSLTSVLPTDADNVYVVLSARMLNAGLQIIARATDDRAVEKMERAGANRVISPLTTSGVKMARFMLNPSIEDFIEIADSHGSNLEIADVQIDAESPYVGQKLADTNLRQLGVMVIGIRRSNGDRLMPPPGTAVIESGDSLFAFGTSESVNRILRERV